MGLQARKWRLFWEGVFVCLGALDVWRMTRHDGSTLSTGIRYVFRTDTKKGKALFLLALATLAVHILYP
jgi:hypothetical protein